MNSRQTIKNIITNLSPNAIEINNLLSKTENVDQLELVKIKIFKQLEMYTLKIKIIHIENNLEIIERIIEYVAGKMSYNE